MTMIQIIATPIAGDLFSLETSEKVHGEIKKVTGLSKAQVERLYYSWTRLYILEKLIAFVRQRMAAYQQIGFAPDYRTASSLFHELVDHRCIANDKLCKLVTRRERDFIAIAPPEHSPQFHFYNTTIRSILQYCSEQKGTVQ